MNPSLLDGKLVCASCGASLMDIPKDASEFTMIHCSKCDAMLGTWGEIQDAFHKQSGKGVFDLRHGRVRKIE